MKKCNCKLEKELLTKLEKDLNKIMDTMQKAYFEIQQLKIALARHNEKV